MDLLTGRLEHRAVWVGAMIAVLFFAVGWVGLPDYGMTWDEEENLLTGMHYVRFFASGDRNWLDFTRWDRLYRSAARPPELYTDWFAYPERYPPVANVVCVLTHSLFTRQLNWLMDVDGYHVGVLLFASLAVFCVCVWTWQLFGPLAATVSTLALVLYPLFFEHAHLNIKDVPFGALVTCSLWSLSLAWRKRSWGWGIVASVSCGLAMGVRLLAIEIWLAFALVLVVSLWQQRRMGQPMMSWFPLALGGLLLVGSTVVFLVSWPWLWDAPLDHLLQHIRYVEGVAYGLPVLYLGRIWQAGLTLPWHYSLVTFVLKTPPLLLIAGSFGIATVLRQTTVAQSWPCKIVLTYWTLTILRSSWPGVVHYDGIRHMMDAVILFCMMAGAGAAGFLEAIYKRRPSLKAIGLWPVYVGVGFLCCLGTYNLSTYHPFEGTYYTPLIGGIRRAERRFGLEYWGSSYRAGAMWLNVHLSPDSLVLAPMRGELLDWYLAPEFCRIEPESIHQLKPDDQVYVVYFNRQELYDGVLPCVEMYMRPVHVITVQGVPLLKIVRTTGEQLRQCLP